MVNNHPVTKLLNHPIRNTVICRHCQTEIADNALICYRCGTATAEPTFKPPAPPRRSSSSLVASALALVLLLLFAVYAGRVAEGTPRLLSWVAVAIGVAIVVLRAYARRRDVARTTRRTS